MPDITGTIRTKKLGETGVTEEQLASDHKAPGRYRMAVVELVVEMPHGPDAEGNRKVDYRITMLEPVPEEQEERVRDYLRTLYRLRPEQQGQAVLLGTGGEEQGSADVSLASMEAGLPEVPAEAPVGEWDGNPNPEDACPVPGCTLPAFHDGDHRVPDLAAVEQ